MDALAKERIAIEIANATRNQERRLQRRAQKAAAEGRPLGEKTTISHSKTETKVSVLCTNIDIEAEDLNYRGEGFIRVD